MSKRQAITAQTKQNIIDAFWALYRQNPGAPITVRDIVMRAGYNQSTFYEYFRDVPAVLEALEEMIIPTVDTLPPFVGAAPQVGMPLEQFWGWYQRYAPYYTVLLGEQSDPRLRANSNSASSRSCLRCTRITQRMCRSSANTSSSMFSRA